jgi:hypothetical protein
MSVSSCQAPPSTSRQSDEVAWYRKFGRYPNHRIRKDFRGQEFVIGDWSWNKMHPKNQEHFEHVFPHAVRL